MADLKEIKNKVTETENRLNFLLEKKRINFEKTQPGSPSFKSTMVDASRNLIDKFALYMIRDEDLDQDIQNTRDEYYAWVKYFNEEVKRLYNYEDVLLIEFYRNEFKFSWNQIDKMLHYSEGSSRKKYYRHIKKRN